MKPGNVKKLTAKWVPGYVVERKLPNGLTYEVRKPGSQKPAEKVHVNRLKACPQSHVYRAARKTTHILGTGQAIHDIQTPRETRDDNGADDGDTDGETSTTPWEMTSPFAGQATGGTAQRAVGPGGAESSGVTTVLEAAGAGRHSSTGSDSGGSLLSAEEEPTEEVDTSESGSVSVTYEPLPVPRPQRPQRQRRPPLRYSPGI